MIVSFRIFTLVLIQNAKSSQICCGFQGGPFLISCSGATRCLRLRENACCAGIRLMRPSVHMCVLPMQNLCIVSTGKMARWSRVLSLLSLYTFLTLVVTSSLGIILVASDFGCKGSQARVDRLTTCTPSELPKDQLAAWEPSGLLTQVKDLK